MMQRFILEQQHHEWGAWHLLAARHGFVSRGNSIGDLTNSDPPLIEGPFSDE